MGLLRVGHDWATSLLLFTFMHWRRKWQPTPVFLPGESQGQGAWWAAVYRVTQSWTRLKPLSRSSSSSSSSSQPSWLAWNWGGYFPNASLSKMLKPERSPYLTQKTGNFSFSYYSSELNHKHFREKMHAFIIFIFCNVLE